MRTTDLGANRPQFSKPHLRGDDCRLLATSLSLRVYIVVKGGDDGESSTQCRSFLTSVFGAVSPESKEPTPVKREPRTILAHSAFLLTTHQGYDPLPLSDSRTNERWAWREGEEIGTGEDMVGRDRQGDMQEGCGRERRVSPGSAKRQAYRIGMNGIEARRSTTWWKWYNELARQLTHKERHEVHETGRIVKSSEGAASVGSGEDTPYRRDVPQQAARSNGQTQQRRAKGNERTRNHLTRAVHLGPDGSVVSRPTPAAIEEPPKKKKWECLFGWRQELFRRKIMRHARASRTAFLAWRPQRASPSFCVNWHALSGVIFSQWELSKRKALRPEYEARCYEARNAGSLWYRNMTVASRAACLDEWLKAIGITLSRIAATRLMGAGEALAKDIT
ncbi:hypothetical protein EDB83DRAFT_2314807 [Lactarius deliciosus]|nr:hypothetical protein EDB83DRAFT_2314807 [Lactarius deliciosus]